MGADTIRTAPDTVRQLRTFEVKARRPRTNVSSAAPVQRLTATEISDLGIADMADAVRRFAGVNVRDYGGLGGLKTVSVRNMGAAHTAVSYDGVPVSNCQGGQVDIGTFSLDNVASLSLAVGHDADLLQPARLYASAAVLSINTERPRFAEGKTAGFQGGIKGGPWGYVNPTARWWQRIGQRVATSLDVNYMRSDGNYPFKLVNGRETTIEHRVNSAIAAWHGEANAFISTSSESELRIKGYWFWSRRGLPGAVTLYNPVSTERLWDRNAFVQALFRTNLGPKWKLQAIAKYTNGWNRDRETGPQFAGGIYQDEHQQHEYYLSATATYTPIAPLTLALAQDGAINKLSSTLSSCPFPTRFTSLSALTARWHRGALTANASLTATYIGEHVRHGDRPSDLFRLNPSISLSIRPVASELFYVRALFKSTFRPASFNDLYYDRMGNRALRPERAREYNLGLTWSRRLFPAMSYLTLTLDGYYNDVDDKIVAFPSPYAWRMVNCGRARIGGLDLTLATSFALPHGISIDVSGAYTWQHATDRTDRDSKIYGHQLPYTPRHSGNAALTVRTPWATLGYSVVAVGKRYYLAQNVPENEIGGYADQTLALSREFRFGACVLTLRGEILNLGGCNYDVIKFYPMPGRSWRLSASLRF